MNGFPGWQAVLRSCPDNSARGDMILFANSLDLEQGGDYIDISIIPEAVFFEDGSIEEYGAITQEMVESILNEN